MWAFAAERQRSAHQPLRTRPSPRLIPRGATRAALASNVDLASTLLALGGASIPASTDGRSLVSALRGGTTAVRDALLIEDYSDTEFPRLKNTGYDAVRTDRYKYIRYRERSGMDER